MVFTMQRSQKRSSVDKIYTIDLRLYEIYIMNNFTVRIKFNRIDVIFMKAYLVLNWNFPDEKVLLFSRICYISDFLLHYKKMRITP
jgi:hypothetical protein